jgi:hypothetical protein
VVAHASNPSTREAEAGGFLSLRPAWSAKWVPGQLGLYRESLSRKTKKKKKSSVSHRTLSLEQNNNLHIGKRSSLTLHLTEGQYPKYKVKKLDTNNPNNPIESWGTEPKSARGVGTLSADLFLQHDIKIFQIFSLYW